MKITFSNLGTIKKTSLDLRPLTVIIGPNNSSKTYVAYATYGLLKSLPAAFVPAIEANEIPWRKAKGFVHLKINDELVEVFNQRLNLAARSFLRGLDIFFQDTSKKLFARTRLEISINVANIITIIDDLAGAFHRERAISVTNNVASIQLHNGENAASFVGEFVTHVGRAMALTRPFVLPAERNAFIISYRVLANRRYKLLKETEQLSFFGRSPDKSGSAFMQPGRPVKSIGNAANRQSHLDRSRDQGGVQYPKPIDDFLDFLTDVEIEDNPDAGGDAPFSLLADRIEQSIQGNNKISFEPTATGGRKLKVKIKEDLSIDLYNASSSIKQLTPLILYLRHRARPDDLLIIDEPEMNLHPEAQAKLLEILAILVNLGVRVLLTTHSPYLMTHLNNITSGYTLHPAALKRQASSLYLKDERAFLPLSDVSAYEMKGNELRSLKDEDYGIRWDTLSDVSVDLQQRYFEIDEKGRSRRVKTA